MTYIITEGGREMAYVPKEERITVLKTDKKWIGITCSDKLTLMDIIRRLESGDILVEHWKLSDGDDRLRYWRDLDGERARNNKGIRYNPASVRKIEVDSAGLRGEILNKFPRWLQMAKDKANPFPAKSSAARSTVKEQLTSKRKVSPNDIEEVGVKVDTMKLIDDYMNTLKDLSEIGALWKFRNYCSKKK